MEIKITEEMIRDRFIRVERVKTPKVILKFSDRFSVLPKRRKEILINFKGEMVMLGNRMIDEAKEFYVPAREIIIDNPRAEYLECIAEQIEAIDFERFRGELVKVTDLYNNLMKFRLEKNKHLELESVKLSNAFSHIIDTIDNKYEKEFNTIFNNYNTIMNATNREINKHDAKDFFREIINVLDDVNYEFKTDSKWINIEHDFKDSNLSAQDYFNKQLLKDIKRLRTSYY
ncbi:hypothetical protein KAU43_05075 [candidate division WOR-3 bacterium]|nr:hypothetical protein [candidate division WOR-3 bacterium]